MAETNKRRSLFKILGRQRCKEWAFPNTASGTWDETSGGNFGSLLLKFKHHVCLVPPRQGKDALLPDLWVRWLCPGLRREGGQGRCLLNGSRWGGDDSWESLHLSLATEEQGSPPVTKVEEVTSGSCSGAPTGWPWDTGVARSSSFTSHGCNC